MLAISLFLILLMFLAQQELPIEDYRTIVKDTTLINVALDLRNKEVFEFLLGKCGGEQERCDLLQEACLTSRKDRLEWLLNTFKCESNKLVCFFVDNF